MLNLWVNYSLSIRTSQVIFLILFCICTMRVI
nr:MAG TPA: hypothetical protein [Caudoviricetes sp.]